MSSGDWFVAWELFVVFLLDGVLFEGLGELAFPALEESLEVAESYPVSGCAEIFHHWGMANEVNTAIHSFENHAPELSGRFLRREAPAFLVRCKY